MSLSITIEQLKTHASNMGFRLSKIPVKKPEGVTRPPPLKSRVREVVLAKGRATEKLQALKELVGVPKASARKERKPRKQEKPKESPPPSDNEEEDVEDTEEENDDEDE